MTSQDQRVSVNIIGSGVLGLTCALQLAKTSQFQITIISSDSLSTSTQPPPLVSPDFASPWAGAFWKSFVSKPNPTTELEKRLVKWETISFKELWNLSKLDPSVVMQIDSHEYFDEELKVEDLPWYQNLCPEFHRLHQSQLNSLPNQIKPISGFSFKTISLNPSIYLNYLQSQLKQHQPNLNFIHHKLISIHEAFDGIQSLNLPSSNLVINTSGLGSLNLEGVQDHQLYPIRGQMVLINPHQPLRFSTRDQSKETYIISRPSLSYPEEVVLGGCYQAHNFDLSVDQSLRSYILNEAIKIRPDLSLDGTVKGLKILGDIVALRPGRLNGPRLEAESINLSGSSDPKTVIHCYGIGGAGFQCSYGMAREVLDLIEKAL